MNHSPLPVKHDLRLAYASSLVTALVMTVASVASILYRATIYPPSQLVANVGTDALSLVFGLPLLLGSMWLARRGSLIGLLLWPGALLYVLYIYVIYVVAVPFGWLFLPYVGLITLSAYTIIGLLASIDGEAVRQRLNGIVPARIVGGVFVGFALLFSALSVSLVLNALTSGKPVDLLVIAPAVSDSTVEWPALLIAGVLLWRRQALGYVAGAGLLLEIGVLFVGLPVSMVLGAVLTGSPVDTSLAVFAVLGAVPLALLAFFVRGAGARERAA